MIDKYSYLEDYLLRQKYQTVEVKDMSDKNLLLDLKILDEDDFILEKEKELKNSKGKKKRKANPFAIKSKYFMFIISLITSFHFPILHIILLNSYFVSIYEPFILLF